jgi:hypothetical protein
VSRKSFGVVLIGVGAFLLVAAVLATVWAPGVVEKTPLDVNTTTHLEGTVHKVDTSTGELGPEQPVKVQSINRVDADASNDDVAVFGSSSCVVIDVDDAPDCVDGNDPRLVSASTDVFATDRETAESVDSSALPADAVPHEGLVNKWPFDSQKKDYEFWDGTLGRAVPAVYDRTEDLAGVECYVYTVSVSDEQAEIAEGTQGTYDNQVEVWIEPRTGAIAQQTQDQQRYLADGTQVLDLKIGYTDDQIQKTADDIKSNLLLLDLVTVWVPVVGFVGGALCLLAGLLLLLTGRRRTTPAVPEPEKVGAAR